MPSPPAALPGEHPLVATRTESGVAALARPGLPPGAPRSPLGAQPSGAAGAVPGALWGRRRPGAHMASAGGGAATLPRGGSAGGPRPAHLPRAGGAGGKPPVPLPDGAAARAGSGGRSAGLPAPMAGERTRRFTRSLLRPGQAAELRHSAAAAAASGRLQLRVSAAGQRPAGQRAAGTGPGARRARVPGRARRRRREPRPARPRAEQPAGSAGPPEPLRSAPPRATAGTDSPR